MICVLLTQPGNSNWAWGYFFLFWNFTSFVVYLFLWNIKMLTTKRQKIAQFDISSWTNTLFDYIHSLKCPALSPSRLSSILSKALSIPSSRIFSFWSLVLGLARNHQCNLLQDYSTQAHSYFIVYCPGLWSLFIALSLDSVLHRRSRLRQQ